MLFDMLLFLYFIYLFQLRLDITVKLDLLIVHCLELTKHFFFKTADCEKKL